MTLGCAHPMGPLALADLIGLDTVQTITESMHAEFKEPRYSPAPLLLRVVEAGLPAALIGIASQPDDTADRIGPRA